MVYKDNNQNEKESLIKSIILFILSVILLLFTMYNDFLVLFLFSIIISIWFGTGVYYYYKEYKEYLKNQEIHLSNYENTICDTENNLDNEVEYDIDNLIDGFHFEEYTAEILQNLNYTNIKVLQGSHDYGTDLLAEFNGVKYAIQCKYYTTSTVGIKAVQEIMGGKKYYNAHISVVATNNYFTNNAINLAKSNNVILWNRDVLLEMIDKADM